MRLEITGVNLVNTHTHTLFADSASSRFLAGDKSIFYTINQFKPIKLFNINGIRCSNRLQPMLVKKKNLNRIVKQSRFLLPQAIESYQPYNVPRSTLF